MEIRKLDIASRLGRLLKPVACPAEVHVALNAISVNSTEETLLVLVTLFGCFCRPLNCCVDARVAPLPLK